MTDISNQRHAAADLAYQEFEFDEGSVPEADGGWEDDGFGNFTKPIYLADTENPEAPTVKGSFNVSFDAGSAVPSQVWATLDGNDLGRMPAAVPGPGL